MNYTDNQLKTALAKMLPSIAHVEFGKQIQYALDTELLHLCWLVEENIPCEQWVTYVDELRFITVGLTKNMFFYPHATWQQRTIALAKVKGVEIL